MAIKKSKTLANGASGEYWKITSVIVDKISMSCTYQVSLYLSKGISIEKKPSLGLVKTYRFEMTPEELRGNLVSIGYAKIKAKAEEMICLHFGTLDETQHPFDADLANGEDI